MRNSWRCAASSDRTTSASAPATPRSIATPPFSCCTAEILANIALREGAQAGFQEVVMDEFHYYADRDRGVAWQTPLLTMPQARFLLMSATLGDTTFFERN